MLKTIATWWSAGAADKPAGLRRQIMLTNQLGLFGTVATLPYQFFYALYDFGLYWPVFSANTVFIAAYLSMPLLNHRGHANTARNLILIGLWTQLFVVTYFITAGAGVHLFYFTVGSILPLIFYRYRPRMLLGLELLNAMLFMVCELGFAPRTGVSPTPLPTFLMPFVCAGSALGAISLAGLFIYLFRGEIDRVEADLVETNHNLEKLSTTDQLTHLVNRRGMDTYLEQEWARMYREQDTLALLVCDVDHFKNYNDHYGHQAGDQILQRLAAVLERTARRPSDQVVRYGGEEFVLILPHTSASDARLIGERIRGAVEALALAHAHTNVGTVVTISVGASATRPTADQSAMQLFRAADRALYVAKRGGRNRVAYQAPGATEAHFT